ncbi:MAG: thiamine phosphate synthase [Pseudomonadota bacterium]
MGPGAAFGSRSVIRKDDTIGYRQNARALHVAARALASRRAPRRAPFCLACFSDEARLPNPAALIRALVPGTAFIFRHYHYPGRRGLARHCRELALQSGVVFILAGDEALARSLNADGLHLPAWQAASPDAKTLRTRWRGIITTACHTAGEGDAANVIGADAIFVSPVFDTASHPGVRALGTEELKGLADNDVPALALGGISAANAALLHKTNVVGFGAIGAFTDDPPTNPIAPVKLV